MRAGWLMVAWGCTPAPSPGVEPWELGRQSLGESSGRWIARYDRLPSPVPEACRPLLRRAPARTELAARHGLDRTLVCDQLPQAGGPSWVRLEQQGSSAGVPNDPLYPYQWNLEAIGAPRAWDFVRGRGVRVAVLDTGVSSGPDGLANLVSGWDFVDGDDDSSESLLAHGTHVAGTLGASTHNLRGVAGVAPDVEILGVRVIDDSDTVWESVLAEALVYAADEGAVVINLSLGFFGPVPLVQDAIAYARDRGVLVVAAGGNEYWADALRYPAAYPEVLAVAALDRLNAVAPYSNHSALLDLAAPGGDIGADRDADGFNDGILQETRTGGIWGFYRWAGTSMATPHVSAAAALLWQAGLRDPNEIALALRSTAVDVGSPGPDVETGAGLLNLPAALEWRLDAAPPLRVEGVAQGLLAPGRVRVSWWASREAQGQLRRLSGEVVYRDRTFDTHHRVDLEGEPGASVFYEVGVRVGDEVQTQVTEVRF